MRMSPDSVMAFINEIGVAEEDAAWVKKFKDDP